MIASRQHAYILATLTAISLACTAGDRAGRISVDTSLVYMQASGTSYNFPQVQDSSRILRDGSISPDPHAPPCAFTAAADTQDWPRTSNTWPIPKWGIVSIRLPPRFSPDSSPGRWEEARSQRSQTFPANFMILIGPMRGYPVSSLGGDVRQVHLYECKISTPRGTMQVADYLVDWGGFAALPTHHLAAHSTLVGDTALLVLAEAHDSITQAQFVAALRTLVLRPR